MDYSEDGDIFVTTGRDTHVRVYDESTKTVSKVMSSGRNKGLGHSNRVYAAKFRPKDKNVIVTGGWDNTVQIWDIRVGQSIRSIYGPHICGDAIDMDAAGSTILTGSWRPDDALQEWDFGSGKLIRTFKSHYSVSRSTASSYAKSNKAFNHTSTNSSNTIAESSSSANEKIGVKQSIRASRGVVHSKQELLYCAAYSPVSNDFVCCGGSGDRFLRFYNRVDGTVADQVYISDKGVHAMAFSADGRHVSASGRADQVIQVHDINI
jgi:WD40 repeat protein